ncbi:hypothetical protein INN71_11360 [Nocardioides sp. ChNu-153]|uniref:hypothetical protein n=1 Tax=unclassified Nocardioides TaxID=2615069 RepID=UPI0024065F52|nr:MULTISPECIES: hypothetical protein [unclassified Nocardioides]MDF9716268.1 hypothetical protein [Nocardioides sp. ChNu-99]MDN7121990.1 hypothetical protein [Nocardioides sp. ChNu-153]
MSPTSLGMPALPPPGEPTWKQAWDAALYGTAGGFLRAHPPTLLQARDAVLDLLATERPEELVLLGSMGVLTPDIVRVLPTTAIRFDLPAGYGGTVLAADWLAHVPTHVVQVDRDGYPRIVHVDPVTGRERLGARLVETGVPQQVGRWLQEWWPVADGGPGARAEVGTARDAAWRDVVRSLGPGGRAVAVESGHTRAARPFDGSLRCPGSRDHPVLVPDGSRDIVAGVALDAVAEATGSVLVDGDGPTRLVHVRR